MYKFLKTPIGLVVIILAVILLFIYLSGTKTMATGGRVGNPIIYNPSQRWPQGACNCTGWGPWRKCCMKDSNGSCNGCFN